jgi:hypothetical protein
MSIITGSFTNPNRFKFDGMDTNHPGIRASESKPWLLARIFGLWAKLWVGNQKTGEQKTIWVNRSSLAKHLVVDRSEIQANEAVSDDIKVKIYRTFIRLAAAQTPQSMLRNAPSVSQTPPITPVAPISVEQIVEAPQPTPVASIPVEQAVEAPQPAPVASIPVEQIVEAPQPTPAELDRARIRALHERHKREIAMGLSEFTQLIQTLDELKLPTGLHKRGSHPGLNRTVMIDANGYQHIFFNKSTDRHLFGGMKKVCYVLKYKKDEPTEILIRQTPKKANHCQRSEDPALSAFSWKKSFISELETLRRLQPAPGIAGIMDFGFYRSKKANADMPIILQKNYDRGSLRHFLATRPVLSTQNRLDIVTSAIEGLVNLHAQQVYHRDIKSPNILVREENGRFIADIADFGLSSRQSDNNSEFAGTEHEVCPELVGAAMIGSKSFKFSQEMDVWALGHALLELFLPWTPLSFADLTCRSTLLRMMSHRPEDRPTAAAAFSAMRRLQRRA